MPSSMPRTRLEQLVQGAHLSLQDFVERFHETAIALGEPQAHTSVRQTKRWLSGETEMPHPLACRVLVHWWREQIGVLLGPPAGPVAVPVTGSLNVEDLLMTTGRESAEHARDTASAIDPSVIENLQADAVRLARSYFTAAPYELLHDLIGLRDVVYQQLNRTNKPRQKSDLYLIAGETCGLLSSVAFDLGQPDSAEELARATFTYAQVIDHRSLAAWARALTMSVLLWTGRHRDVIKVATAAADQAPTGTARARLLAVRGRALAHLGAVAEVTADLTASAAELDVAGDDDLMDDIGGELGFDHSRLALCAGSAYVALRDGERAETEAIAAVRAFARRPPATRWRAGQLAAHVDLAAARAISGDLAGAEDALTVVFALQPDHRTVALTQRLETLSRIVGARPYRGALEAGRIVDAVAEFTARALPSTPPVPRLAPVIDLPIVP